MTNATLRWWNTSRGLKGTWCETEPSDRRERSRWRGRAVIGRDRELVVELMEELVVEVVEEESKALRRGLWRVRRERWVGRWNPSMETSHRSGGLEQI